MLLKDSQVLASGVLNDQLEPTFCDWQPKTHEAPRRGSCPGVAGPSDDPSAADYQGGKWFLTLNGQRYPNVPVNAATGEIWRITAASASNVYDLRLTNPAGDGYDMVMQILSIDGVALHGPRSGLTDDWLSLHSRRGRLVSCPNTRLVSQGLPQPTPVCATSLFMMPGSRVELWVAYRDAAGRLVAPSASGSTAVLRTVGVDTGPAGDQWPAVDLAQVDFSPGMPASDEPAALAISRRSSNGPDFNAIATDLAVANAIPRPEVDCKRLPTGHHRRIFYGNPTEDDFGLGYEEVDAWGVTVPGSFVDVRPFDPDTPTICLTLADGNRPANEVWELVNLTGEDHNFHIHQVRFHILKDPLAGTLTATDTSDGSDVLYDNLPLLHGRQACLSVQAWHAARDPSSPSFQSCDGRPDTVSIPFAIAGDFVFHCHILEHEDGGMMARIRVRSSRTAFLQ